MNKKWYVAVLLILSVASAIWNLYSAESIVTPAMAGHWEGNAQIIDSWCQQTNLSVAVDIQTNGIVTGKIGDATLVGGHFQSNRGWLGRKLNLASDYIIKANFDGPIVAAEGIKRDSVFIGLNFTNNAFIGGINTSGSMGLFAGTEERKEKMFFSARNLKLTHPKPSL